MKRVSIIIFDEFTDLDLFLMWDLFNRVKADGWDVKILGDRESHVSATGIEIKTHGPIELANEAEAVIFVSGFGTRERILDADWLGRFRLDPTRQMLGSICSGALILAKLGFLEGKTATTYPTVKSRLEAFGVEVVEQPFVRHENVATAGGCLAQQYLVKWVIGELVGTEIADLVVRSIQPVGEGLFFDDADKLGQLYDSRPARTNPDTPDRRKAAV